MSNAATAFLVALSVFAGTCIHYPLRHAEPCCTSRFITDFQRSGNRYAGHPLRASDKAHRREPCKLLRRARIPRNPEIEPFTRLWSSVEQQVSVAVAPSEVTSIAHPIAFLAQAVSTASRLPKSRLSTSGLIRSTRRDLGQMPPRSSSPDILYLPKLRLFCKAVSIGAHPEWDRSLSG